MPNFQLRWINRSQSNQDWMIHNGDNFTLAPDHVRTANITIHNDYTFQVVVSTNGGNAHASISYTAATNVWALVTHTPNEWQLAQGNGIVTLRCLLEDVNTAQMPDYMAEEISAEGKAYPAYQLYDDNNDTT